MVIGSTSIKHWFPDFPREPKDLDIIYTTKLSLNKEYIKSKYPNTKIEFLLNEVIFDYRKRNNLICGVQDYLEPDYIYTLKISHCLWDLDNGSWLKHIWDVQWLKEKGCKFIPELFYQLYSYWETIHGKRKTSNLNMSAEKFFDNVVGFPVEHDYLHTLLIQHPYFKGQELPTYTKILKDGAEVDVSEEKFNLLTEQEKFNLVFEEVAVMGIERYGEMYYKKGYNRMLKKFILNHAPVWEAIWIVMNHKELSNCPFDFLTFLNNKIKQNESTVN